MLAGGGRRGRFGLGKGMLQTVTRGEGMFDMVKCWVSCCPKCVRKCVRQGAAKQIVLKDRCQQ